MDTVYIKFKLKELAYDSIVIKLFLGLLVLAVSIAFYPLKATRKVSLKAICWSARVIDITAINRASIYLIKNFFLKVSCFEKTVLLETYLLSGYAKKTISLYSQNSDVKTLLYRDVLILKKKTTSDRGVILIKYTPAFDAFYALYDLDKLFTNYIIVLEPSWIGACDPSLLIFWRNTDLKQVIIQASEPDDYNFINKIGGNFVPIDIGASDWVDKDIFSAKLNIEKEYDIVMLSNWALHKKHSELFKSLTKTRLKLKVLLIGYPWDGRDKSHIEKEISRYPLSHIRFVIKEAIPATEVSKLLAKSKVYLLLSKREGANKALIEALSMNVPAIIYDRFKGGAQTKINADTGILSSYENLHANIEYMVENYNRFSPRRWVEAYSGSAKSTVKLNKLIKDLEVRNGNNWTCDIVEKVNNPNLEYKIKKYSASKWDTDLKKYLKLS